MSGIFGSVEEYATRYRAIHNSPTRAHRNRERVREMDKRRKRDRETYNCGVSVCRFSDTILRGLTRGQTRHVIGELKMLVPRRARESGTRSRRSINWEAAALRRADVSPRTNGVEPPATIAALI